MQFSFNSVSPAADSTRPDRAETRSGTNDSSDLTETYESHSDEIPSYSGPTYSRTRGPSPHALGTSHQGTSADPSRKLSQTTKKIKNPENPKKFRKVANYQTEEEDQEKIYEGVKALTISDEAENDCENSRPEQPVRREMAANCPSPVSNANVATVSDDLRDIIDSYPLAASIIKSIMDIIAFFGEDEIPSMSLSSSSFSGDEDIGQGVESFASELREEGVDPELREEGVDPELREVDSGLGVETFYSFSSSGASTDRISSPEPALPRNQYPITPDSLSSNSSAPYHGNSTNESSLSPPLTMPFSLSAIPPDSLLSEESLMPITDPSWRRFGQFDEEISLNFASEEDNGDTSPSTETSTWPFRYPVRMLLRHEFHIMRKYIQNAGHSSDESGQSTSDDINLCLDCDAWSDSSFNSPSLSRNFRFSRRMQLSPDGFYSPPGRRQHAAMMHIRMSALAERPSSLEVLTSRRLPSPSLSESEVSAWPTVFVPHSPDEIARMVNSLLEELTPETLGSVSATLISLSVQSTLESDARTLKNILSQIFEKACDSPLLTLAYAQLCARLLREVSSEIRDFQTVCDEGRPMAGGELAKSLLLAMCQKRYERGWGYAIPTLEDGCPLAPEMMRAKYRALVAEKKKYLGFMIFLGNLFNVDILTESIIMQCLEDHSACVIDPSEIDLEILSLLLKTVGPKLENRETSHAPLDRVRRNIKTISSKPNLSSRTLGLLLEMRTFRDIQWQLVIPVPILRSLDSDTASSATDSATSCSTEESEGESIGLFLSDL